MHKAKSAAFIFVLVGICVAIGFIVRDEMSISGATVANTIACYNNSDCNDHIEATEDLCLSAGTPSALCVNRPIKK
jgi:hypothetical protein